MSLITQCPACATLFKVVPDQLRVSDGWVRCGQCDEVFDANAHLQTTQQEARQSMFGDSQFPPDFVHSRIASEPQPPRQNVHAPEYSAVPPQQDDAGSISSGAPLSSAVETADSAEGVHEETESETEAAVRAEYEALLKTVAAEPDSESSVEQDEDDEWVPNGQPTPRDEWADAIGEPVLSFMQPSVAEEVVARPWVRPTLFVCCLVLSLSLVLQVLMSERDRIAVKAPAMAPLILGLCDVFTCKISALREIESVVIESSSFVKVRADVYRVHLTLKNTAIHAVATPALELTLTNVHDQPIVRRVILPLEYGVPQDAMAPGAELPATVAISTKLSANSGPISGYRLLVFYP